jgi:hypothetical protein
MKKAINLPAIALVAYLTRLLVTGASIGDAIFAVALCALYGFWCFTELKRQVPVNKAIMDRICDLEEQLKVTKEKVNSFHLGHYLKK